MPAKKTNSQIKRETNSIYIAHSKGKSHVIFIRLNDSHFEPTEKWAKFLLRSPDNYQLMSSMTTSQVAKYIDDFIYDMGLSQASGRISYLKSTPFVRFYQKR